MTWLVAYIAVGAVVGVLAGMLGIGGGMTLVPILAALFTAQGLAPGHDLHLALGTAMASILFTSAASAREHHKLGGVDFGIVWKMAPGMIGGTFSATLAAGFVQQRYLALCFALIVFIGATQILLDRRPTAHRPLPGATPLLVVGFIIGIICGLISAGGAFLTIPFMLWCGVPLRTAIGTAALLGIPMAAVGSVGHVIAGWGKAGLPPDALGFISVFALVALVSSSVVTAPFGARLAHRMPVLTLKRIFACVLYLLAVRMLLAYW